MTDLVDQTLDKLPEWREQWTGLGYADCRNCGGRDTYRFCAICWPRRRQHLLADKIEWLIDRNSEIVHAHVEERAKLLDEIERLRARLEQANETIRWFQELEAVEPTGTATRGGLAMGSVDREKRIEALEAEVAVLRLDAHGSSSVRYGP